MPQIAKHARVPTSSPMRHLASNSQATNHGRKGSYVENPLIAFSWKKRENGCSQHGPVVLAFSCPPRNRNSGVETAMSSSETGYGPTEDARSASPRWKAIKRGLVPSEVLYKIEGHIKLDTPRGNRQDLDD